MRVNEKGILPVRLVSIGQLLPQQVLLILAHRRKLLSILLVQAVVSETQSKADEHSGAGR